MWTVFLFLLVLRLSRCTVGVNYETKTVDVGDKVTLSCPRDVSSLSTQLFWFRLVSGALPEVLGGTFTFDDEGVVTTSCCKTKQEPETFVLSLDQTKFSDAGLYFCLEQTQIKASLLKGVFLRIKEPGPELTTVIKDISSDPARPWDSKTLQCSVLYDPDSKPCPGGPRVFWIRSGSDESGPSFIYTHGNRSDGCEKSSEAPSLQKCTYSFSESVSSSDEETFYCAVAACGEILLGNGTKIKDEGCTVRENYETETVKRETSALEIGLVITSVFLLISLIGNVALICYCTAQTQREHFKSDVVQQKSSAAQKNQQTDAETNVLSVAVFTLRGAVRGAEETERIYAAVKAFGLD